MDRIKADFATFFRRNPAVWGMFCRFALDMIRQRGKASAKAIWERLRWEVMISHVDKEGEGPPRLNNNYTALYARKFEEAFPHHKGVFAKRKRRSNTVNSTAFDEEET